MSTAPCVYLAKTKENSNSKTYVPKVGRFQIICWVHRVIRHGVTKRMEPMVAETLSQMESYLHTTELAPPGWCGICCNGIGIG